MISGRCQRPGPLGIATTLPGREAIDAVAGHAAEDVVWRRSVIPVQGRGRAIVMNAARTGMPDDTAEPLERWPE